METESKIFQAPDTNGVINTSWRHLLLTTMTIAWLNNSIYMFCKSAETISFLVNTIYLIIATGCQALFIGSSLYRYEQAKILLATDRRKANLFGMVFKENFRFQKTYDAIGGSKTIIKGLLVLSVTYVFVLFNDQTGVEFTTGILGLTIAFAVFADWLWLPVLISIAFMTVAAHQAFGAQDLKTFLVVTLAGLECLFFAWFIGNKIESIRFNAARSPEKQNRTQIVLLSFAFLAVSSVVFVLLPKKQMDFSKAGKKVNQLLQQSSQPGPSRFQTNTSPNGKPGVQRPGQQNGQQGQKSGQRPGQKYGQRPEQGEGQGQEQGQGPDLSQLFKNPGTGNDQGEVKEGKGGKNEIDQKGTGKKGQAPEKLSEDEKEFKALEKLALAQQEAQEEAQEELAESEPSEEEANPDNKKDPNSAKTPGKKTAANTKDPGKSGPPKQNGSQEPGGSKKQGDGKNSGQLSGKSVKNDSPSGKTAQKKLKNVKKSTQPKKVESPKKSPKINKKMIVIVFLVLILIGLFVVLLKGLAKNKKKKSSQIKPDLDLPTQAQIAAAMRKFRTEYQRLLATPMTGEDDCRARIIELYNLLLVHYESCGLAKPGHFTPDDFDRFEYIYRTAGKKALTYITGSFNRAYYGLKTPAQQEYQNYCQCVAELGTMLGKMAPHMP